MAFSISKAIPIKFWLDGEETFNEQSNIGVTKKKFYQKFVDTDDIVIQFTDTNYRLYKLLIFDESDTQLQELTFTREEITDSNLYKISFSCSDYSITGKIYLKIIYENKDHSIVGTITEPASVVEGSAYFKLFSSGSFRYAASIDDVCDATPQTIYWEGTSPWGIGTVFYTDISLETVLSGQTHITDNDFAGNIFTINNAGLVISDTGIAC